MDDREFIERFEDCTLPEDRFHHLDHVRAAGKPDRYHETITWAYLCLIPIDQESGRAASPKAGRPPSAVRNPYRAIAAMLARPRRVPPAYHAPASKVMG